LTYPHIVPNLNDMLNFVEPPDVRAITQFSYLCHYPFNNTPYISIHTSVAEKLQASSGCLG